MAVNPLAQQVACQLVQHFARRIRQMIQDASGNRVYCGVLHRIEPMRQHNPRPIGQGQLARILQSCLRLALEVRRDHNGLQAVFKAHGCLPAAGRRSSTYRLDFECALPCQGRAVTPFTPPVIRVTSARLHDFACRTGVRWAVLGNEAEMTRLRAAIVSIVFFLIQFGLAILG